MSAAMASAHHARKDQAANRERPTVQVFKLSHRKRHASQGTTKPTTSGLKGWLRTLQGSQMRAQFEGHSDVIETPPPFFTPRSTSNPQSTTSPLAPALVSTLCPAFLGREEAHHCRDWRRAARCRHCLCVCLVRPGLHCVHGSGRLRTAEAQRVPYEDPRGKGRPC